MQDFIQLMITSMELKGFAKNTQKTCLGHIRCFAEFCANYPASAGYDDIRAFLYHSITKRKFSLSLREFLLMGPSNSFCQFRTLQGMEHVTWRNE